MEYLVFVSAYTNTKLQRKKSGWSEELKNLGRELNYYSKEGWAVKDIIPTALSSGIIYTVLLQK